MSGPIVYINPQAGRGRAPAIFTDLCRREPRLATASVLGLERPAEMREELRRRVDEGAERIVVLGGDGTVQLVADVLLRHDLADRAAIGIVPAGSGSDLARNLGLPREPMAAMRRALDAAPRAIDAFRVSAGGEVRFVVNVASAGVSGPILEIKRDLPGGRPTDYLRATLDGLKRYHAVDCRVRLDGEVWFEGPLFLLAVANSKTFGNAMKVAPRAILDDGLADVVLVRDLPGWHLPLRLPQIYVGSHLKSRYVASGRARRVEIEPFGPLPPYDLDGEIFAAGALAIEVLPGALRVLA
jgi:diacylglycerol kinase (ATP)